MAVFGQTEAEDFEKFDMDRQRRKPLFAPDYQRRTHKMIVDSVREMISGDSVRFQNNDVLIIFRNGDIPFHGVVKLVLDVDVARDFKRIT